MDEPPIIDVKFIRNSYNDNNKKIKGKMNSKNTETMETRMKILEQYT